MEAELVAALFAYQQTNGLLEAATFSMLGVRDTLEDTSRRVAELRYTAEERAVTAYMNGTVSIGMWSVADFAQSALLAEAVASSRRADSRALEELVAERGRLVALRASYADEQIRLEHLREDLDTRKRALEDLFIRFDARLAAAAHDLAGADARYRAALSDLEEARRRRAALAGVESWRSLVERFFPPDLVEQALSVMHCESRGNPDATHPGSGATGLFQFLEGTWAFASAGAGFAGASRYDAEANVAAAAWLVDYSIRTGHPRGAWGHWVCQPAW